MVNNSLFLFLFFILLMFTLSFYCGLLNMLFPTVYGLLQLELSIGNKWAIEVNTILSHILFYPEPAR